MHILILSHCYPYKYEPNFGFFCKQQAEALVMQGNRVGAIIPLAYSLLRVLLRQGGFPLGYVAAVDKNVSSNIFFFPALPGVKWLRYLLTDWIGKYLLRRYIRENGRPDLIHLQTFLSGRVAIYGHEKFGMPIVWTEHLSDIESGSLNAGESKLLKDLNSVAAVRIAVSETFCKSLTEKFGEKFFYIPNVYDSNLFHLPASRPQTQPFKFIHVANLTSNKNQSRLLRSFAAAFKGSGHVELIIIGAVIGKTPDLRILKKLREELGLEKVVHFLGFLPPEKVYENFCSAHAFVLSSNYETFGVSIVEAMASGLPAISTRSGGPESILVDNGLGVLCEKTDESLTAALTEVFTGYLKYNPAMISQSMRQRFSYEAIGEKLTKLYLQCK